MRFMMIMIPRVYQPDTPGWERATEGFVPPAEAIEKMSKFNDEMAEAGALITLEGLHPGVAGARVSFSGGTPQVTEGPSLGSSEVIGGYWLINASSKEEAIKWAKRCPASDGDVIEIRQVFEISEFPPNVRTAAQRATRSEPLEKGAGRGAKKRAKSERHPASGGA
jgi:hypothetical protein